MEFVKSVENGVIYKLNGKCFLIKNAVYRPKTGNTTNTAECNSSLKTTKHHAKHLLYKPRSLRKYS